MTLPEETLNALESLVYGDVEDLVALHGEENRRSILTTKAMLMELGTEHLEWLKPVLAVVWNQGHKHCFHVENPNNPVKGNPYKEKA